MINLTKPLVFFDLETTGLNISSDRIVSIAITKISPDHSPEGAGTKTEKKYALVNPEMPIPKESSDIHGITDEMVKDKPTFRQLSKGIYEFMNGSDLGGYNNNFYDNSLLQEEFSRCGIQYPTEETKSVDCCFIFKHFEKRDLSAALRYYCNEEMVDAHNSEADTNATVKIFMAQVEKYPELKGKSIEEIAKFCNPDNRVDWQGKIVRDKDGDYAYNFGTSKGQKVKDNKGFADWIMNKDFPATLKSLLTRILKEK
jgi:DNA polymerase-3 subunit epsilon